MVKNLVVTHNGGFFSCAGVRLVDIYKFYMENHFLPTVDSSKQWYDYKDDINVDITYEFFKPEKIESVDFKPFQFIKGTNEITQFFDYKFLDYENISFFIEKYFSPSDEVLEIKNNIIKKYDLNLDKTITVFYRGNDKNFETNVPSYEEMLLKVIEIKKKFPDYKLLIQTDEYEFSEFMKKNFDDFVVFEESMMMSRNTTYGQGSIQYILKSGEKVNYGKTFLAIMLIMSESKKIILPSGNIGMWICLFRKNSKNVYQHLNIKKDGFINKESNIINNWINHE